MLAKEDRSTCHRSPALRSLPHELGALVGEAPDPPKGELGLQAGEWVRIKSAEEIRRTLSPNGKNVGLSFEPEMAGYIGQAFQVAYTQGGTGAPVTVVQPITVLVMVLLAYEDRDGELGGKAMRILRRFGNRVLLVLALLGSAETARAAANIDPIDPEDAADARELLGQLVEDAVKIYDRDERDGSILILTVRAHYAGFGSLCRTNSLDIRTDNSAPESDPGRIKTISVRLTYRTIDASGAPLGKPTQGAVEHLNELCRASEDKGADFEAPSDYEAWQAVQLISAIKAAPAAVLAKIASRSCGEISLRACGRAATTAKRVVNGFALASARRREDCTGVDRALSAARDCEELLFQQEDAETSPWRIVVGFIPTLAEPRLRFVRVSEGE